MGPDRQEGENDSPNPEGDAEMRKKAFLGGHRFIIEVARLFFSVYIQVYRLIYCG